MKHLRACIAVGIITGLFLPRAPHAFAGPFTSSPTPAPFLVGGNAIDWECNSERCSYGHDLGHNGWSDIHLSMHGYSGKVTFQKDYWLRMMDDLVRARANFIRIPAMTEGQGILWEPWVNGRADRIKGADPAWIARLKFLLDQAQARGLRVQIGMLTGNTFRNESGMYNFYHGKNLILKNPETMMDYLKKVIHPVLTRIGSHPALEHFEIMGETDGAISTANGEITELDLRIFLAMNTSFIRKNFPELRAKLSASIGFGPTPEKARRLFANTGLDFAQIHLYNQEGSIGDCGEWSRVGLPIMLGEFGLLKPAPVTDQARVMKRFIEESRACGFMGAAMWAMDYGPNTGDPTRYNNLYTMDGKVKPEILSTMSSSSLY